jgi:hypothetical protein
VSRYIYISEEYYGLEGVEDFICSIFFIAYILLFYVWKVFLEYAKMMGSLALFHVFQFFMSYNWNMNILKLINYYTHCKFFILQLTCKSNSSRSPKNRYYKSYIQYTGKMFRVRNSSWLEQILEILSKYPKSCVGPTLFIFSSIPLLLPLPCLPASVHARPRPPFLAGHPRLHSP